MFRYGMIFFIFVAFVACNNTSEKTYASTTEIIEIWDNGRPKVIRLFSIIDGQSVASKEVHYYAEGQKHMEGELLNDKRQGEWKSWYRNGNLWSIGSFKNGLRHGKGIVYYPSGKKFSEGNYLNGQRSGNWQWWDNEGKQISEQEALKIAPSAED